MDRNVRRDQCVLLAALVMALSFGLGSPDATPTPVPPTPTGSQLPKTAPGLSSDEGFFVVTRGDDGADVIYFIAQNTRHSISPDDLQREWQLNPMWPWRVVDRNAVLAFAEAAPIGAARVGLLSETVVDAPAVADEAAPAAAAGAVMYTVQRGDTLNQLSARFGTTVQAISNANGIHNPDLIYVAQMLAIPTPQVAPEPADEPPIADQPSMADQPPTAHAAAPAPPPPPALSSPTQSLLPTTQPGLSTYEGAFLITTTDDGSEAIYFIAQNERHSTLPGDLRRERQLNPLRPAWSVDRDVVLAFQEAAPIGGAQVGLLSPIVAEDPVQAADPAPTWLPYSVRAGDTLNRLSARNGTTVQAIVDANHIPNRNLIYIGQTISIPSVSGQLDKPPA